MSEFKTWLEAIEANFKDSWTREMLIQEAAKTLFIGNLPAEFAFLRGGFLDLGFEKLGLSPEDLDKGRRAFVGSGLAVAGTGYRIRNLGPGRTVVEPADGSEQATLPDNWKQGVVVLGNEDKYRWIGKRASPSQLGVADLRDYEDAGDGWVLKGEETGPSILPPG